MGCWFSSEEEGRPILRETSIKQDQKNEGHVNPTPHKLDQSNPNTTQEPDNNCSISPPSTSSSSITPTPLNKMAAAAINNLEKDIRAKWEKSMHTLPVAADFPRLAKLTKIIKDTGELEMEPASPPSVERIIYSILLTLALQLNDSQSHESMVDKYWSYLRDNIEGEVRREFDLFLKNCLNEDSKVAHVLKTINQGMIAPAVISLKLALPTLPFKDFRNSWRIEVIITEESVTVVHIRREQSFNTPPEMTFEFVWECRISFDKDVTKMDEVKIRIIELAFGSKVGEENTTKIKTEMQRFLSDECVFSTLSA